MDLCCTCIPALACTVEMHLLLSIMIIQDLHKMICSRSTTCIDQAEKVSMAFILMEAPLTIFIKGRTIGN